ncbi:agamous-like MADS-box protein AGL80 [Spinacia oleracea]|uniref:Agamous-like MADS-box protein AGL80 n=1 Tax=Spinacia oleracea TaxID=3562 RepID=A0A9R0JHU1_SPIOL|nr:agamous-like MADS-box protein AGL80 [Spinacia oleracea]
MTRNKVKLEYITNDSSRKATFKKRKKGLLKKVEELTTLCGVEACAIICSPYDTYAEAWPSKSGARNVLARFMSLSHEKQGKKMLDQETYLGQRVVKAEQQLEKLMKDNREREITKVMYECLNGVRSLEGLNLEDTMDLFVVADKTSKMVAKRIESLQKNAGNNK